LAVIGQTVGPFQVLSKLGEGGMGQVYRARDNRLGRDVAIKVLPPAFANDADRRARFEREAQAVAALSHPNIVAIHDTGLHQETGDAAQPLLYVVMELLSGQTLRERLLGGALPVRKAVEIAVQIARGLGAAHGKGVVHRDLKPENVFLLDDGQVKILDFGLARQATLADHSGATQTVAVTDPGTVMGTVGYMAPEQVRGLAVDARADVFAFGAVLYEMVSGTRAFQRATAADSMSAILTQDPPELTGSRPDLSPALDRIIRHCLEKNPNERFQSARDVAFALEALSGSGSTSTQSGSSVVVPVPASTSRGISPLVTAALVVAAAAAGVILTKALQPAEARPPQFTMKTFDPQSIFNARFMPDGETIIFSSARTGNAPELFEIRPGTVEARRFGPPRTHLLSISSKGELAVITNASYIHMRLFSGTLARMTLEGAPRPWLEKVREADWSPDGTTMAVIRDAGGSDRLEYPIGTTLYEANGYLSDVRVSPDRTRVAFMQHPSRWDDRGFVKMVDVSKNVTTLAGEYWGMEGLAWSRDGLTVSFAASAPAVEGTVAGSMTYQIYSVAANGRTPAVQSLTSPANFTIRDFAANGRWLATREEIRWGIVARGAGQSEERDLTWLMSWSPDLSSDGQRVLFSDGSGGPNYAIAWRKIDGSPVVRLGDGDAAGWSPDGRWALAFIPSASELIAHPTGAGEARKIATAPLVHVDYAVFAADSKSLMVFGNEQNKKPRFYRVPMDGGTAVPVLPENVFAAVFSADGSTALGRGVDGSALYPLSGGPSRKVDGIEPTERVLAFSDDNRALFVIKDGTIPVIVDRLDLATGKRTF
jgi:serine/threonine protein kinase